MNLQTANGEESDHKMSMAVFKNRKQSINLN